MRLFIFLAFCRRQVLRYHSKVSQGAIERITWCALSLTQGQETRAGPKYRPSPTATLTSSFLILCAFRSQRFPNRVHSTIPLSFCHLPSTPQTDHRIFLKNALFLLASSPIKLILYVHLQQVGPHVPYARTFHVDRTGSTL